MANEEGEVQEAQVEKSVEEAQAELLRARAALEAQKVEADKALKVAQEKEKADKLKAEQEAKAALRKDPAWRPFCEAVVKGILSNPGFSPANAVRDLPGMSFKIADALTKGYKEGV